MQLFRDSAIFDPRHLARSHLYTYSTYFHSIYLFWIDFGGDIVRNDCLSNSEAIYGIFELFIRLDLSIFLSSILHSIPTEAFYSFSLSRFDSFVVLSSISYLFFDREKYHFSLSAYRAILVLWRIHLHQ